MADNLSLQALVRIQALDAREVVGEYRERWTGGAPLAKHDATAWMRHELGASNAASFALRFDNPLWPTWREWKASGCKWAACDDLGAEVSTYASAPHSAMHALARLVCGLGHAFGREWIDGGAMYVLSDVLPVLEAVSYVWVGSRQEGGLRNASGPLSGELVLLLRPQATLADVNDEYRRAQRKVAGPRARTRPIGEPRTRDLAVLGARVALGDFTSWPAAMDAYNAEHSDPLGGDDNELDVHYRDPSDPVKQGLFRRDVRAAYRRVTGMDVDFRPGKGGGLPTCTTVVDGEAVCIPTGRNALPVVRLDSEEEYRAAIADVFAAKQKEGERK